MKYALIQEHAGQASIRVQCEAFGVSRSGYYAWRRRQGHPSRRQLFRDRLDRLVLDAFEDRKGRSGAVGLTLDLDEQGRTYKRKTVAASMKRQGLRAKAAKKYKATTDSDHGSPVAPNRLERDFTAEAPTRSGFAVLPIFGPVRVGCTRLWCWTCSRAWWWAGPWTSA